MKILVIFTGGTIGSRVKDGWISPAGSTPYLLLDGYLSKNKGVSFDTLSPYTVLSENLSADNLTQLLSCVSQNLTKGYDGIIITHGTDTLQYTAAALGFAFGRTLPIALVSSQKPLEDPLANGHDNFAAAAELIRSGERGVFAVYRNNDGRVYVHHASRLLRHGEVSDDLYSLSAHYGVCEKGRFVKNPDFVHGESSAPSGAVTFCESSGVLNIFCHPRGEYDYELSKVGAVLLQPYHSGTLCTSDDSFVRLCKRAADVGVPLFAVNVTDGAQYASSKAFKELGIRALPLCAAIPVYMKLWMAKSLGADPVQFVSAPIYEEFLS